jgi:hypothetical protein
MDGGDYDLVGTAGQPEGSSTMQGAEYVLVGGFWGGGPAAEGFEFSIHLPLLTRGTP